MKKGIPNAENADAASVVRDRPSHSVLDERGYEHPDPTPVEMPTRLKMPGNQVARIRAMIQRELSASAERDGLESFAEADDFEVEDVEWSSPYEELFEPVNSGIVEAPGNGAGKEKEHGGSSEVVDAGSEDAGVGAGVGSKGPGAAGGKARKSAGRKDGDRKPDSGSEGASGEGEDG